jgi:hypothetical protein
MILLGYSIDRITYHYRVSGFGYSIVVKVYLQYMQMNYNCKL